MLTSGEIKSIKLGRSRRIPLEDLEAWVAAKVAEQAAERVA
jgi:excisionase family DNA binding protein